MDEQEQIEKLISLEIENKINDHSAVTVNISIKDILAAKGMSEEKIEEFIRIFQEEMAKLLLRDPEKFKDVLRDICGVGKDCAIDIIGDDC